MTVNYIVAGFAAFMVLVVIPLKVFADRQMTITEAIPMAIMFALGSYALVQGGTGFIFIAFGIFLLTRFYARVAPEYKRRMAEHILENGLASRVSNVPSPGSPSPKVSRAYGRGTGQR